MYIAYLSCKTYVAIAVNSQGACAIMTGTCLWARFMHATFCTEIIYSLKRILETAILIHCAGEHI